MQERIGSGQPQAHGVHDGGHRGSVHEQRCMRATAVTTQRPEFRLIHRDLAQFTRHLHLHNKQQNGFYHLAITIMEKISQHWLGTTMIFKFTETKREINH